MAEPRVRVVTLNASKAGITRLRTKGGASPETLLDLTNGYVNASKCPQQRPGTTWLFNFADSGHTGNTDKTKGLVAFKGIVYTFTHDPAYATSGSSSFVILVLRHPTNGTAALKAIHYAAPFMGFLYVVAEFADGVIKHYWLQAPAKWTAATVYLDNAMVQPSIPNGYYYQAQRRLNPPAWTALFQYKGDPSVVAGSNADRVQPTTYNGYYFIVGNIQGAGSGLTPPIARSGSKEPSWVTTGHAIVYDYATTAPLPTQQPGATPPAQTPPGKEPGGRYTNQANGPKGTALP